MIKYFKDYKIKTVIAVLFKFIEACFELLLPLLMVSLINEGILLENQAHVYKMAIIMVLLSVFGYLASITCQYFASVISQRVGGRIRTDLMHTIIHMNPKQRADYDNASLIIRSTTDIDKVVDMIAKIIRLAVRAPMIIFGSVGAMYLLNPELSMILLASIPLFTIVIAGFMFLSVKVHTQVQSMWDEFTFKLREYLDGIRVIYAFNKAKDESHQLKGMNRNLSHQLNKMGFLNGLSSPFVALLMNALLIFLVYLGAIKVNEGVMNQSQILALINYCTQIVLTLIVFMNLVMIFSRGLGSWKRIKDVLAVDLSLNQAGTEVLKEGQFEMVFDKVSFSYPNQRRHVLEDISFKISSGMTLGIVGLTGSGKSTLLKLMANHYQIQQGSIVLNDKLIESYSAQNLRNKLGYIAQKPQFIKGTLSEAISLDHDVDVAKYLTLAQGFDILEKGLDAPVSKGAQNFSGGQRQRMSIARQWAKEPSVLMFDDSFSALDAITQRNLKQALKDEDVKRTIVIASQRTTAVEDADHILVLDQGKLVSQGTHKKLLSSCGLYQKIYELDLAGGVS